MSAHPVFGTALASLLALLLAKARRSVNTCFVERHNGTDRNRCRQVRQTYGFSKDWESHRAASRFSHFSDHLCWPVRTRRVRDEAGRWRPPAMVAG